MPGTRAATTLVVDNDQTTIALSLSATTVSEGEAAVTATATLGAPPAAPITLTLSASPAGQVTVPATVTFGIGQTTATFSAGIVDDTAIDGSQALTLSLGGAGWTAGTTTLTVLDNENTNLALTVPATLREGLSVQTGTVTISGTLASALVVNLTSSDTTELTVPATVTIPAGQTSANFSNTVIDDTDLDGAQNVTITAASAGFTDATTIRSVGDNDAHHFSFATIGSPQVTNGPIPVIITARDVADAVVTSYASAVTLTASGSGGALTVTPATLTGFVNGVKTAFVQINATTTGVQITATDALGRTGTSNLFDLAVGNVTSFAWDTVPSPQTVDAPFPVRIRALDGGGNTATGFNGAASLGVIAPVAGATIGNAGTTLSQTIYSYYTDARSTALYTAAEVGAAGRLSALAFNVTSVRVGGELLDNFTIRIKHTSLTAPATGTWDNAGWTQVYRATTTISGTGWATFNFTTPFDYNGTSNLLVDVSFDRATTNSSFTDLQGSSTSNYGTVYGISSNTNGDPLAWTTTPAPSGYYQKADIRLSRLVELPIRPNISGNFTNGVWDGQVSVPFAASGLSLRASAGILAGTSNTFATIPSAPTPSGGPTLFSENFESGTFDPTYWTITGTGPFRSINTTANIPRAGTRHLVMDSSVFGTAARNEATLALNLTGRSGVTLSFWAKSFNDTPHGPPPSPFPSTGADFDGVAISADSGANWYEVQPLRSLTASYVQYTVNLDAAMAARGLSYSPAFRIRFNQYGLYYATTSGIAIDDIAVTATPSTGPLIAVPAQATEGAMGVQGTLTLSAAAATDTLVALASSAPAKASVPPTALILAGQTSVSFPITLPEDVLLDGAHAVYFSATVAGVAPQSAVMMVSDNETGTLTLTAPATAAEGATGLTGTISVSPAFSGAFTVALASNDTTELTVPATVTIPLGQSSATFPITIINDTEIDGTQSTTITASAAGITSGTAVTQVTDNETRTFSLSGPSSVYEGLTSTGTVYITGTLPAPLVVTLTSSNPTQFSVPATVTIPAGSTSATFVGTAVDDTAMDGTATATITASSATFTSATYTVNAFDNDVHHFSFNTIATAQVRGRPFSITALAKDVNNSTITVFTGTANLSAAAGATPLTMTPTVTGAFSSGQWTGSVTISTAATSAAVTATGTGGITGASNIFNVGAGSLAGLVWGVVPSPQTAVVPFASTLSAQDAYGNTVTTFNGAATVAAGPQQRTVGAGAFVSASIFTTGIGSEGRSQMIYLASEVGAAGRLTGLAFNLTNVPSTATRFTIRVKHTTLSSYTTYAWETAGWTTVFQGNVTPGATGLLQLNFTTPFDYNGTSNLMLDCSFDGTGLGSSASCISFTGGNRQMYYYTFNGTDPLTWPNTNTYYTSTYLPNLKLRVERTIPVVPSNVTLTSGVWSGNLTLGATGTNLTLTADTAAGLTGESNVFSSVAVAALAVTPAGPVSTAGYRGGPFTPLAHTFTVTNGGSGAMSWTASNATPWLSLSLSGGTLASGASTSVVATLDASQLAVMPSGSASAVVSFANTTNGIGNTTRVIQLSVNAHGQLVITPGAGGNYTLTNSGDAALNWTLAADAWLSATPTSGTLAIGATASVSVTPGPLAALLAKGHYEGALVSTNTSTGHGNATLTFMHDVLSPAPVLQPEPPITGGTTNTISWVPAPSALEGEAQAATDAGFTAPQNSGVVAAVAHTFASVAEGLHYYRARARELLRNMSAWGQGTPAALGAGTKTNVIADATGIVLVNSPGGPIAGRIVNESFETDSLGSTSATSWAKSSSPAMFFIVEQYSQGAPLPTDGTKYAVLYTGWSVTHVVGESISISQTIDFTGSTQLVFDSTLTKTTSWMNAIRAEVKIDGTSVWSKTTEGSATNQAVNVSSLSGVHVVSLECSVILGGVYDPQWACFDNLRLNGIGGYASSGNLVSAPISRSLTGWGQLLYTADTPAGSGLTVDVLDSANAVLATAVPNGTDLNNIPAVAAQTSIRLRANLTSTNTAVTPRLRNWLVSSVGALATVPTAGPWSNVVASTQDATGPAITRTSALAVGSASYIPGGSALDLAGVQSLTVNGIAATTTNAFATWIAPAITLTEGANTLTVTASDNAVPPNTTTATWTVTLATDTDGDRLPDAWEIANGFDPNDASSPEMNGDGDGDGINNLLEFALALDPQRADGAPCSTTIEVNPADGLRYMVYHYRRRAALQTWGFDIQTGTAPGTWTGLAATEEAAPPTVHADAVGETLHLRILPALGGSAAGFYRLRVTAP